MAAMCWPAPGGGDRKEAEGRRRKVSARLWPQITFALIAVIAFPVVAWPAPLVHVRLHVEPGLDFPWGGPELREDAAAWLARQLPGWEVRIEPPRESPRAPLFRADEDALRLVTISRPEPGAGRTVDVHYVAAFAERVRGRTWSTTDGRALVVLPASSLAAHTDAFGAELRERRVLRHELIHAIGWVPARDHRLDRGGSHCSDFRCLMHQGPTLADLLASIFAPFTRYQAHELCARCRSEVAALAAAER